MSDNITLTARLEKCYSGAVYDVLRANGHPNQVLPRDIRPLLPEVTLAGPVFTVYGEPDSTLNEQESLLEWTRMLAKVPSGRVVVCQPNDDRASHMGELSAETFAHRGVLGYLVDGGSRDTAFIKKIGFPVFCKYTTPIDIVCYWAPKVFDGTITIGDVNISADDYIIADIDGAIVIPKDIAEDIISKVEVVMQTENKVRTAILNDMAPDEAYLKYGKF